MKYPVKNDCIEEVKLNLKELGINLILKEINKTSQYSFKRMVKVIRKECTLQYLLALKGEHTQMENLEYSELKLQGCLKDPDIAVAEARHLNRYRTKCAKYKENMKSSYPNTPLACPLCLLQPDTQKHSLQCHELKAR